MKTKKQTNKEEWIKDVLNYIDKYAEKIVVQTIDYKVRFGYKVSIKLLEDALIKIKILKK